MNFTNLITFLFLLTMPFFSCSRFVSSFAFYPDRDYILTRSELPKYVHDVDLVSKDGTRIHALHLRHDKKPKYAFLYFHGNAGNSYHRISDAWNIYKRGFDVLICEYRGYGRSEGKPDESGVYQDALAAWNYLNEKAGFSDSNVYLYGRSLGTAVAIESALIHKPAAMILVTPFSSGYDIARENQMGVLAFLAIGSFDSESKISKIHTPLLVLHGDHDEIISMKSARKLYDAGPSPKKFIVVQGAGHNNISALNQEKFWNMVFEFVDQNNKKKD